MIYAAIIFFCFLLFLIYRRNGIDAAFYMTVLYLVTLIAGVFVIKYQYDPFKYADFPISLEPTFVYCTLIGITLLSVARFNTNSIEKIIIHSPKTITVLTWIFGLSALIYLISQSAEMIMRLHYGDFGELRDMIYDEDLSDAKYSGLLGKIVLIVTILCSFSYIMIPILCVSLIWENRSKLFYAFMIFASVGVIFMGIMGIDRSKVLYYILLWGLCLIIFWRKFDISIRKRITPILGVGIALLLGYFALVTNDRFGERKDGNTGGLVWYTGQSYINFCYFWDNFEKPDEFSTRYLFPATHHFIYDDYVSGVNRQIELTEKSGIWVNVFFTFLGSFLVDCNHTAPFLYVLLFLLLMIICKRHKQNNEISFLWFLCTWILLVVPTTGIIAYMYNNYSITITIAIVLIVTSICEYLTIKK